MPQDQTGLAAYLIILSFLFSGSLYFILPGTNLHKFKHGAENDKKDKDIERIELIADRGLGNNAEELRHEQVSNI